MLSSTDDYNYLVKCLNELLELNTIKLSQQLVSSTEGEEEEDDEYENESTAKLVLEQVNEKHNSASSSAYSSASLSRTSSSDKLNDYGQNEKLKLRFSFFSQHSSCPLLTSVHSRLSQKHRLALLFLNLVYLFILFRLNSLIFVLLGFLFCLLKDLLIFFIYAFTCIKLYNSCCSRLAHYADNFILASFKRRYYFK